MGRQLFDPYVRKLWSIDPIMAQKHNNNKARKIIPRVWKGLVSAVRTVVPISDRYNAGYTIVDFCRMLLMASFLDASVDGTASNRKVLQKHGMQRQNFPQEKRFRAMNGTISA